MSVYETCFKKLFFYFFRFFLPRQNVSISWKYEHWRQHWCPRSQVKILCFKYSFKGETDKSQKLSWAKPSIYDRPKHQFCQSAKWLFAVYVYKLFTITQLLAVVNFAWVSLVRENMRGLRENLKHKIWSPVVYAFTMDLEIFLSNQTRKVLLKLSKWPKFQWLQGAQGSLLCSNWSLQFLEIPMTIPTWLCYLLINPRKTF